MNAEVNDTKVVRTVFTFEKVEHGWGEIVPELRERFAQLTHVDRARTVAIEVSVDVLPILDSVGEYMSEYTYVQVQRTLMYFQRPENSLKPIVPVRSVSYNEAHRVSREVHLPRVTGTHEDRH